MEDNMMRKEATLILPYNTLRIVDVLLQFEIYNSSGILFKEPFEKTVFKMVTRRDKKLSTINKDVDQSILDQLLKINFADYYDMSPKTNLYDMLNIVKNQKFMTRVVALFDNNKSKDDTFESDYYDGSIDGLEDYILKNNITCIVMDDMELLKTLSDRGNVDLNYKTIMISKMGYNYFRSNSGKLLLKHYDEILDKYPDIELTVVSLVNFSKEVFHQSKEGK